MQEKQKPAILQLHSGAFGSRKYSEGCHHERKLMKWTVRWTSRCTGGSNEVRGECLREELLWNQLYLHIHARSAHCGAEHHWLDQAGAHSSPQMLDSPEIHHVRPQALGGCCTCLELGQQCRDHLEEKGINIQEGESYIPSRVAFPCSRQLLNSCSEKDIVQEVISASFKKNYPPTLVVIAS